MRDSERTGCAVATTSRPAVGVVMDPPGIGGGWHGP
jgi:hypothetical protein